MSDILIPVQVILKLFTLTNGVLGRWVEGNALTDPAGTEFANSLAVVIDRITYVLAWLWGIF